MKKFFVKLLLSLVAVAVLCDVTYAQEAEHQEHHAPKKARYVFLFIGDGMGFSHIALTEAYKATKLHKIGSEPLWFTQFPVMGMATTYSHSNMITCSSAAGTALATGYKTNNHVVGMGPDSVRVRAISYKLKELGYKIGIMTSVTIDHATPAAFYGYSVDRNGYYTIAMQLPETGFDFFGGGGFQGAKDTTVENAAKNIYDKVAKYGYTVGYGLRDFNLKKKAGAKKMILFQEDSAKVNEILPYVVGRTAKDLKLKQVLAEAVDFLYEPDGKGFFIMCEGGKIDWAAHSNDVLGTVMETLDMDSAIRVAYEFYKRFPDETLIVVTADHETGGVSLGRKKGYVFDLSAIDEDLKNVYTNNITVENYMSEKNLSKKSKKAQIGWTTISHTGGAVPVFAIGAGSRLFAGRMNNTDIPKKIMKAMGATPLYTDHYYRRVDLFATEKPINKNDIVFLGNSLTEGGDWASYFPDTEGKLNKKGGAIRNRGINGDTFGGIDNRLGEIVKGSPAKIFLLTGVNDVSHNLSADSIANGIMNVVKRIKKESPKTKIYLQSLLPINESFKRYRLLAGKSAEPQKINALLAEGAKREKIEFVNLYPLFLEEGSDSVLKASLTKDGLHVNAEGYKIWADAIRKFVK